jgi:hypothetical protein
MAKASWGVLKGEKQLVWLPVFSFAATLVVAGGFGLLVYATRSGNSSSDFSLGPMSYVLIVAAYVALAFATTYFLAALVAGANARLQGGDASLGECLRIANSRLHRILPWAVVAATVSIVLQALERQGWIGRIVSSLLGLAWGLLTFLTVPIIVLEDVGPVNALKRSKDLFVRTWGENVFGQFGLGIIGFLAALPAFIVIGAGVATGSAPVIVVAVGVGVAWFLVVSAVMAALSGIYRTALYRYAVDRQVPGPYAGTDLEHAFAPRESRGFGRIGGFGGGFSG